MLIGVVVPSLSGSFTAETIQGVHDVAEGEDMSTLLYTTGNRREKVEQFVRLLWEKRVDGLLYFDPLEEHTPVLEDVSADVIPVVQVLYRHEALRAPYVCVDQYHGG